MLNRRILCDMHSHLLPGMDDGCKSIGMAAVMLHQATRQELDAMVCTPHYYPEESIASFLARRQDSAAQLTDFLDREHYPHPRLFFGAEAAYYEGLAGQPDLRDLCITGTDWLLLEMPFRPWTDHVLRDVYSMIRQQGLHVIIAHIERYHSFSTDDDIEALREMGALIQVNGSFLLEKKTARRARRMLGSGMISLLGSDTHDPSKRPQTLGEAFEQLDAWGLSELADDISACSTSILHL